jgi:polyhydroxyalkanoate synthesis regulator phasin
MNKDKKIHQTPAALKQHAWKTPLSIASLALIAVVSISSVNIDAIAEEPAVDTNRTAPIDYTANTFVKITDALIAGEITPEEAAKKIHTTNRINTYLTKVETDISVAVESGKMTVDEGMEKYDAAVKNINKRMGGEKGNNNERAQAHLKKIGTDIREAIANGEMTPEEGKAKYAEAETKMQTRMGGAKNQNNDRAQAYLTKIGTEIKVAVANGELTSEEGKAKYLAAVEGIQKRMARASKGE